MKLIQLGCYVFFAGIFPIGNLGINFSEVSLKMNKFLYQKMNVNMSAKGMPFLCSLDVLILMVMENRYNYIANKLELHLCCIKP